MAALEAPQAPPRDAAAAPLALAATLLAAGAALAGFAAGGGGLGRVAAGFWARMALLVASLAVVLLAFGGDPAALAWAYLLNTTVFDMDCVVAHLRHPCGRRGGVGRGGLGESAGPGAPAPRPCFRCDSPEYQRADKLGDNLVRAAFQGARLLAPRAAPDPLAGWTTAAYAARSAAEAAFLAGRAPRAVFLAVPDAHQVLFAGDAFGNSPLYFALAGGLKAAQEVWVHAGRVSLADLVLGRRRRERR